MPKGWVRMTKIEQTAAPLIAAARTLADFRRALASPVSTVFLLGATVLTLPAYVREAKTAAKRLFVHLDLTDGLGKDEEGLQFIARLQADGIITTKANLIRAARGVHLQTVQRFFIIDSHSIDTALTAIESVRPDYVEVMPGVIPKVISRFCTSVTQSVVAGGLIESAGEARAALRSGADFVSSTVASLWELPPQAYL